ncbi:MAG: dephospho-CoA kinase [Bacteroidales bacterium]|nr:dephospho-CoA kinase [Bacteroidales bacterium]
MTTVLVTGPIGGGKSTACKYFASLGLPVYDCDSRCKALYTGVPGLKARIEQELGIPFAEIGRIFSDSALREKLEAIVYPLLLQDLTAWKSSLDGPLAFVESAIALDKPAFDGTYDEVLLITAPAATRALRNPEAPVRGALQHFPRNRINRTIRNDSTPESLYKKLDKYLKTI